MAENLGKWPSKRGPISKIRPQDGCGRDAVPLAVERWYDFPECGGYLGNVGLEHQSMKMWRREFLKVAATVIGLLALRRNHLPYAGPRPNVDDVLENFVTILFRDRVELGGSGRQGQERDVVRHL